VAGEAGVRIDLGIGRHPGALNIAVVEAPAELEHGLPELTRSFGVVLRHAVAISASIAFGMPLVIAAALLCYIHIDICIGVPSSAVMTMRFIVNQTMRIRVLGFMDVSPSIGRPVLTRVIKKRT
jgi:hypothetical protein